MSTSFSTLSSQKSPHNCRVVVYEHSCSPRPTMDQIGEHGCGNGLSERHRVPARGTAKEVVRKVSRLRARPKRKGGRSRRLERSSWARSLSFASGKLRRSWKKSSFAKMAVEALRS